MILLMTMTVLICGLIALAKLAAAPGTRALSGCSKIILSFLKSAHVLFGEFAKVVVAIAFTAHIFGNHFVLDYYIISLFSSMILIRYHILTTSKYPSVNF